MTTAAMPGANFERAHRATRYRARRAASARPVAGLSSSQCRTVCARPRRAASRPTNSASAARLSAQLMINCCDRNCGQTRRAPRLPFRCENEQRHAVGPAGNRQHDIVEPCETREGGVRFNIGDRRMRFRVPRLLTLPSLATNALALCLGTRLHTLSRIGKF